MTTLNPSFETSFSQRTAEVIKKDLFDNAISLGNVDGAKIQVGLAWEFTAGIPAIDLDVAAACFNNTGTLTDAAFYNQRSAAGGAVEHSGDCKRGEKTGFDETVMIDFAKLSGISVVVFVLSCFSSGDLRSCESAMCEVKNVTANKVMVNTTLPPKSEKTGFLVGVLFKHPDNDAWHWSTINEPVRNGRTFMAALPQIRKCVDQLLDPGVVGERKLSGDKSFNLSKGDSLHIDMSIRHINLGLGWSTSGSGVDLDASCVMLKDVDGDGKLDPIEICYFGQKKVQGVQSMGDNMTGAGDGDDETLKVNFNDVDPSITSLAFVVNVFSQQKSFMDVNNAYVRLYNPSGNHEYCRYKLDVTQLSQEARGKQGLVFCTLSRCIEKGKGDEWDITMIGENANGRVAREITTPLWDGNPQTGGCPYRSESASPSASAAGGGGGCCVIA